MAELYARRKGGQRAERTRHEWSDLLPIMLRSAVYGRITQGRFRQPWSRRLILIKWVLSGEAILGIGGRRLPFGPGQVAIHIPTHPHRFWMSKDESEMCWFSVDGALAEQFVYLLGLRAGVFPYEQAPLEGIKKMIASLSDQSHQGAHYSSLLAIRMIYEVAAKIPPSQSPTIVHQIRHLIREGLSDPELSAGRLAGALNYNRAALSRLFHQQTGMTIMDCITRTRLETAELLLTKGDARIGDVARQCGFQDRSYFSRWIRKKTGRSPAELRDMDRQSRGVADS